MWNFIPEFGLTSGKVMSEKSFSALKKKKKKKESGFLKKKKGKKKKNKTSSKTSDWLRNKTLTQIKNPIQFPLSRINTTSVAIFQITWRLKSFIIWKPTCTESPSELKGVESPWPANLCGVLQALLILCRQLLSCSPVANTRSSLMSRRMNDEQ